MPNVLHALFVAWQDSRTRRFHPVGRLAQIERDAYGNCFEFVYIQGARQTDGFQPFLSFPDLSQVYRGQELFPMFDNRLVSKKRADYPEYVAQLGLSPATASPMMILGRSSGRRTTDTLELFPLPEFEPGCGYRTWFWARGLRYLTTEGQTRLLSLSPGEQLLLRREPDNSEDSSAVQLLRHDGVHIGYMPAYLLDDASELQETCSIRQVHVERVNPPPVPVRQRLLCRMEACWPDGFVPYTTARFQPLAEGAATIQPDAVSYPASTTPC